MQNHLDSQISSVFAVLLNCVLYVLTLKYTPKQMVTYSRIIRLHCILDSLFCLKVILTLHEILIINGHLYIILHSPIQKYMTPSIHQLSSYPLGIFYVFGVVPIDFIYRYLTVCKERTLTVLQLIGMFLFVFLFTCCFETFPACFFVKLGPSNETVIENKILLNFMDLQYKEMLPTYVVLETRSPYAIFAICAIVLMITFDYIVIIYTIRKINATVNQSMSISKEAHDHILRVLIIQGTIPLILCLPFLILIVRDLFSVDIDLFSGFSSFFGIWYTFFKCLATILAVPAYRKPFFQLITLGLWQKVHGDQEVETIDRSAKNVDLNARSRSFQ